MTTDQPDLDVEAIRKRCEAASPPPWNDLLPPLDHEGCDVWPWYDAADMEFAYHARTDVPALLTEVDRLRAALATAEREREEVRTVLRDIRSRSDMGERWKKDALQKINQAACRALAAKEAGE